MSVPFCDLPEGQRMAIRRAIDEACGEVADYQGEYVQVAMPRGGFSAFLKAMDDAGLEFENGSLQLFPLGSDSPPEHLRHDGSYAGSRGFWMYARFKPRWILQVGQLWRSKASGNLYRIEAIEGPRVTVARIQAWWPLSGAYVWSIESWMTGNMVPAEQDTGGMPEQTQNNCRNAEGC